MTAIDLSTSSGHTSTTSLNEEVSNISSPPSSALLEKISQGQTNLTIKGNRLFREAMEHDISILLKTSEGRELVERVIKTKQSLPIIEIPKLSPEQGGYFKLIGIGMLLNPVSIITTKNQDGELQWTEAKRFTRLAHEFIHFLHDVEEGGLCPYPATQTGFPNFEEQYTVTGDRGDGYYNRMNERAIAAAYKLPIRANYFVSSFPLGDSIDEFIIQTGVTRLHDAAIGGALANVKDQLRRGANLECRDRQGHTPLSLAVLNDQSEIVKFLLKNSARVNTLSGKGFSPFAIAMQQRNYEIGNLLLTHKANIDSKDSLGFTPLLTACRNQELHTVQYLVERGADLHATNYSNMSCLYLAREPTAQKNLDKSTQSYR